MVSTETTETEAVPESVVSEAPEVTEISEVSEATAPEPAAAPAKAPAAKKPKAPRVASTAKKTRTVELTLTVTGTAEGEWQAELSQGGKRMMQGVSVPATAVSRAAAELHEDISKAIETVLDAAREQHRARMEELEAELSKVKAALAELQEG
ncbi:hypothetical protein SAMN05192558_101847 [Actinokineospora alba]|uniref:Uncharacterized protein n=1 Tax=Actinokineospora alba TaxID=504798 RepID=A0A1H0GLG8_9PSEU|nr:hypothetical protein C8E96_5541 [Actinokineospora alba]SDI05396.1 hypothetical protein SAMN05421871_10324 [Actinokineospora alba]SDO07728.1 hypothetical protein SAMN05192558_101847 [Actinokineospora alba]